MSVLVLQDSHRRVTLDAGMSVPEALGEIARWLIAANTACERDGSCQMFSVAVHADGADCDHERPKAKGERHGRNTG